MNEKPIGTRFSLLDLDAMPGIFMDLEVVAEDDVVTIAYCNKKDCMLYSPDGVVWFDYAEWAGTYQIPERMGTWTLDIL